MKLLLNGASLAALLLITAPSAAESPMTPSRPLPSPSNPWVEPPSSSHSRAAPAAPAAGEEAAAPRPPRTARTSHHASRRHYSRWASDHMASRLNRWQLSGGYYPATPYYRGFGPSPYSNSGP